jgi:hypothetical protein
MITVHVLDSKLSLESLQCPSYINGAVQERNLLRKPKMCHIIIPELSWQEKGTKE